MYHDEVAKILFKLLNKKGIINIGGKAQYIYNFAKKENKKVKKIYQNKNLKIKNHLTQQSILKNFKN